MSDDPTARLAALEQLDEDLFDFPDVEGMAELIATSRAAAASGPRGHASAAAPRSAGNEPNAPLPAPPAKAPKAASSTSAAPRNASDLDEDLFGFGDLFELGATPAGDAEAAQQGSRAPAADDAREAEPRKEKAARPAPPAAPPALTAAGQPPAVEPVQPSERKPKEPKEKQKKAEASTTTGAREQRPADAGRSDDTTAATPMRARRPDLEQAPAQHGAPFLPFPASIDLPPARSKILWVLVGCFLLANGGVFMLTQQQNQNVNQTLVAVTSTLAEAVARGSSAAPRDRAPYDVPAESDLGPARAAEPLLDAADFSNTNELGLHNARRLIEQGAYAEARRNLFFILANQDRSTPLTPTLREDIDYLIALTYYDQGRSIAVEDPR